MHIQFAQFSLQQKEYGILGHLTLTLQVLTKPLTWLQSLMHKDQGSQIHNRNNKSFSLKLIKSVVSKIEEQTEKT